MKVINKTKIISVLLISICALFLFNTSAHADGSVGVTGSFSTYEYQVVQGEKVDSPLFNVVFVNNYSHDIKLEISQTTPNGVNIILPEEDVPVAANSRLEIPIVIEVAKDALPGTYPIYVKAKLVQELEAGKVNIGSEFALSSKITIFGEAGDIEVDVVDVAGNPIRAVMNLYQIVDGTMAPLAYSEKGIITEKVIPGEYEVIAFWNEFQLVREKFSVAKDQHLKKSLVAETVQIYAFTAVPVLVEGTTNEIATANLNFVLHNIYEEYDNSRVVMEVYKNNNLVEKRDIFVYESLEVKKHNLGLHYVPAQGWGQAEYRFELKYYVDERNDNNEIINSTLYASSLPAVLDVSSGFSFRRINDFFNGRLILYVIIAAVLTGLMFLIRYLILKKPPAPTAPVKPVTSNTCPECSGHGSLLCPVCEGTGKTMYGTFEEECMYCSGIGEVMCAACIDPNHLIVCPRCSGNAYIEKDGEKQECTLCNGLGHVVDRQYAVYVEGTKMKLGKKDKETIEK